MKYLASFKNPTIKFLASLRERKARQESRLFLCEGERELERAVIEGWQIDSVAIKEGVAIPAFLQNQSIANSYELKAEVFERLSVRDSTTTILGVLCQREVQLDELKTAEHCLFIALQNVEKPGNLGAILRTADAIGAAGVFLVGGGVDPWNPNVVRSSLGTIFSVPVLSLDESEFFEFAKAKSLGVVGAALCEESKDLFATELPSATILCFGEEARGLTPEFQNKCDGLVEIPMNGIADSLNVSVAVGVIGYEWLRQSKRKSK